MSTRTELNEAIISAVKWHSKQLDKGGNPYIFHPLNVMMRVAAQGLRYDMQIAAVLHDVVEDCGVSVGQIRNKFGKEVAEVVAALTRDQDEEYLEYIHRLKADPRAAAIKRADLTDNMRPDRWHPENERLVARYRKALEILDAEAERVEGRQDA